MKHTCRGRDRGFTLLELTLATLLLATLVLVSYGWYREDIARANIAGLVANIDAMRTAFKVESSSGEHIPDFGSGQPGKIPPELTNLAIPEEMLSYPGLSLAFTYTHLPVADHHVFLALMSRDARGAESLRALARTLPSTHFTWLVEPVAAMVPMIDDVHVSHVLPHPGQTSNQALPQPLKIAQTPVTPSSLTVAPQPQVASSGSTPTNPVTNVGSTSGSSTTGSGTTGSGTGSSSGGSSSGGSSSGSGGGAAVAAENNCHSHPDNNGHGHGHAYGHCKP